MDVIVLVWVIVQIEVYVVCVGIWQCQLVVVICIVGYFVYGVLVLVIFGCLYGVVIGFKVWQLVNYCIVDFVVFVQVQVDGLLFDFVIDLECIVFFVDYLVLQCGGGIGDY